MSLPAEIHKKEKFSFVIPVYNHQQEIFQVIQKALKFKFPVFVVDDGSTDSTFEKIKNIKKIRLLRHQINTGKGSALMTGWAEASKISDWAITIDADGQHNPEDAKNLIQAIPHGLRPIMVGIRKGMSGKNVRWASRFGRKFSNFWVLLSGGPKMTDSQSGFRIYPLPESMNLNIRSKRFQFEVEILAKAGWKKIPIIETPVSVTYQPGKKRVSHYRPFVDFLRNSLTFSRLIIQRIFIPWFIRKRL
ncbi:MAG: glycosyltransferase family 2 protein [Desulfobacterales bacterium]|nr:glycosyltransferase family 2 protein [Deltaproteobacteria bacterium]NNK84790.1 glycosyltransferase family 2 protein [Desulfobacterales bacterium]NNL41150.1 glycosyltransferase family 2 protein [Desulfobacterales bacterium]